MRVNKNLFCKPGQSLASAGRDWCKLIFLLVRKILITAYKHTHTYKKRIGIVKKKPFIITFMHQKP